MENEKKRIKLALIPLFFSSFFLIFGTYAWFTYFSDIDSTMTGHVVGWNIDFDGDTNIESEYSVIINDVYPGMKDYKNEVKITNSGEATAQIESIIKSIRIFDVTYNVGDEVDDNTLTSEDLYNLLVNNYPFNIGLNIDHNIISSNETSTFTFTVTWPFESYKLVTGEFDPTTTYYVLNDDTYVKTNVSSSNFDELKSSLYILNDKEDTKWGEYANNFRLENPDTPCIELKILLNASQYISEE